MKQNTLNNLQSLSIIGPSRPQDIISFSKDNINLSIDENNRARILFQESYYKCRNNHIFVNENFDSPDSLTVYREQIHPNSHVHIFLNTRGCDEMRLFDFCCKISQIECTDIIIHSSEDCTANRYISKYFPKLGDFKIKLVRETLNSSTDFWCTEWWSWQTYRTFDINSGEYSVKLSVSQPLTGICVKLNAHHSLVGQTAFDVIGINHRKREDTFEINPNEQ